MAWRVSEKRTGERGLGGDHGGGGSQQHHGIKRPRGVEQKKGIAHGLRRARQQRALPQIIQHQRGKHQAVPSQLDRRAAEMPHVGIQRLGASKGQQHGAQHHERRKAVLGDKPPRVLRMQRAQHLRMQGNLVYATRRQRGKPCQRDRPEPGAQAGRAMLLHEKQPGEHAYCKRHHIGLEHMGADRQSFDRRQHGNRRRQHGVAVEQRSARHAGQCHRAQRARPLHYRMPCQREQSHDAAFAVIVGTQHQQHVFQGHHQHQRPENRRRGAEHGFRTGRNAVRRV